MHAQGRHFTQITLQNRAQFIKADAPARQFLAVAILRKIRLTSKHL